MDIINCNVENITHEALDKLHKKSMTVSLIPPNIHLIVVSKLPTAKNIIRITLPHRIDNISVCVLIKDINKSNYDKTTDSWKRRWNMDLGKCEIPCTELPSVTFIPLRELKLAYQTFVAKRRLAATFDLFLADRRIIHHLPTKLGKAFYSESSGKAPIPATFTNTNIVEAVKKHIHDALFIVRGKGMTESLLIGNTSLSTNQIKENIRFVCEKICNEWPGGGISNIRSIYAQTSNVSLPLYLDETEVSTYAIHQVLSTLPKLLHKRIPSKYLKPFEDGTCVNSNITHQKYKSLTNGIPLRLLSDVSKDLPLPRGGIKELLSHSNKFTHKKKLISKTKKKTN